MSKYVTVQHKPAALYVPINLDIPSLFPPNEQECAKYILNQVHWRDITWRANPLGYVQLNAVVLRQIVPWRLLPRIMSKLLDNDILESDLCVIQGSKSRGYRLTQKYKATYRTVCTDDRINRKIREHEEKGLIPAHRWMRDKLQNMKFDFSNAESKLSKAKPRRAGRITVEEYRRMRLDYCRILEAGDHFYSVDDYGRTHTLITALEKELRPCITLDGLPLVGLDLANSQPLMLGLFCRQYRASKVFRSRILNKEYDGKGHPYLYKLIKEAPPEDEPADLTAYIEVCEQGEFYQSMMTDADRIKGIPRFKVRFYRGVLFGRNTPKNARFPNVLLERFRSRYPTVGGILKSLKARNYRHSAHVMQNYESTIFIYNICGRIMTERPITPLLTVHDCLLTTAPYKDYVKSVMLDEFRKLGVCPKIHEET